MLMAVGFEEMLAKLTSQSPCETKQIVNIYPAFSDEISNDPTRKFDVIMHELVSNSMYSSVLTDSIEHQHVNKAGQFFFRTLIP